KQTNHTALALGGSIDLTWIAHSFRNQFTATLFWDRYIMFRHIIHINVRKVHIIELHPTQLFQLLFYPTTHFQSQLKDFFQLFFGEYSIWINQLQITVNHSSDRNSI